MTDRTETVDGYVIDMACIRKNSRDDLLHKAQEHTRECTLMGHCVESGYGIVTKDDRLTLLDPAATPKIVNIVRNSETEKGIRLHVTREEQEGKIETADVVEK